MSSTAQPWQRLDLVERMPKFARRVLEIGCGRGELGRELKQRWGIEVYGIESNAANADVARSFYDGVVVGDPQNVEWPFPPDYFDALLVSCPFDQLADAGKTLLRAIPFLQPNGYVFLVIPDTCETRDSVLQHAAAASAQAGLVLYARWTDERLLKNTQDIECAYLLLAVRESYNPVEHARELSVNGNHPGWSYEILTQIPEEYLETPQTAATVAAEIQLALLAWDNRWGERERIERFFNSQVMFYRAVSNVPEMPEPYQCHAEFWHRINNDDMARRLLTTIHVIAPSEATERQKNTYAAPAPPMPNDQPPAWRRPSKMPRVLLITHLRADFGLDILYDGLCAVLGAENVVEFPWKPTLHGSPPSDLANYPCACNHPGEPLSLDEITHQLRRGKFDWVLFGDTELNIDVSTARSIGAAARNVPVCIVDQRDDPKDIRPAVCERLGLDEPALYLKRELLACVDFGPQTFPLPFAYPDHRVSTAPVKPRANAVFWAGHRSSGLRRAYLEHLQKVLAIPLDATYVQDEYARLLDDSRIGLCFFGFGFDTVRYWELPAHGCLLLAERLPLRIPHNFIDGESAVFFDDLTDLKDKVQYYLDRPDEAAAIAERGRDHLMKFHTGSARARQLLGYLQAATHQFQERAD